MKVIKHGVPPTSITTCPDCGCQFAYTRKDVYESTNYDSPFFRTTLYVECPDCGNRIPTAYPAAKDYEKDEMEER